MPEIGAGYTMREAARRTALVTGASAGIGLAFAHVFAERGFDLVVTARRGVRLEALARELAERHGTRTTAIVADLSDPATPARIVSQITAAGIPVDALVNNAGYGVPGDLPGEVDLGHPAPRAGRLMLTAVCQPPARGYLGPCCPCRRMDA